MNDVKARLQYLSKGRSIKTNLEEAITEPYRHLERLPDDEDALMNLLVCELKLGRFKDGEQTTRKLTRRATDQRWVMCGFSYQITPN